MVSNVYAQFREEEQAAAALRGRYYSARPIIAEFSPVTDFREATCRQFEENVCNRGGYCNFMHVKKVSRDLRRRLFGHVHRSRRSYSPYRYRPRTVTRSTTTTATTGAVAAGGAARVVGDRDL
jgi:splicing factor U2AF 35 kDa subunit